METSNQLKHSARKTSGLLFTGILIKTYMTVSLIWVWVEATFKTKGTDSPGNSKANMPQGNVRRQTA